LDGYPRHRFTPHIPPDPRLAPTHAQLPPEKQNSEILRREKNTVLLFRSCTCVAFLSFDDSLSRENQTQTIFTLGSVSHHFVEWQTNHSSLDIANMMRTSTKIC
jgi:hypothetical protein